MFPGIFRSTPIKFPSLSSSSTMNPEKPEIRTASMKDESVIYDSGVNDSQEGTLHRGLKARQISMIAVRHPPTQHLSRFPYLWFLARWCSRHWLDHRLWYCTSPRWPTWYPLGLLICRCRVLPCHGRFGRNGRLPPSQERLRWLCHALC